MLITANFVNTCTYLIFLRLHLSPNSYLFRGSRKATDTGSLAPSISQRRVLRAWMFYVCRPSLWRTLVVFRRPVNDFEEPELHAREQRITQPVSWEWARVSTKGVKSAGLTSHKRIVPHWRDVCDVTIPASVLIAAVLSGKRRTCLASVSDLRTSVMSATVSSCVAWRNQSRIDSWMCGVWSVCC